MVEQGANRWGNLPGDMRGVLPAGTSLRGYELISILGQGAFGITYRARDLQLHRDVAVKEYLPTSLALREGRTTVVPRSAEHAEQFAWGRERFMDEARTLARLDRTPAIVRVHDFLEDNGTAYMVMALIEGETLARRLAREQRLSPDAVERIVFPLLDGLEEVHGIGFLHRDIKPANIMIDEHGRPTLIDFGASRAAMAERSTTLTAIFTPGYAAAEQFTAAKLGPWTDIYGLAATLYHVITGNIPPSAIERILKDTYEPLSTLQPEGFPPGLLAGIDAGLAIRVENRPKTIAEWRQMLRSDGYGASGLEATRIGHRPGRLARAAGRTRAARVTLKGPSLWGAAAAAILLIMGGSYLAMTSVSPSTSVASLSAEQLEQALAERRKADAFAAEKRRLEEEARQKAEADAETKRQADAELEQARQARQKAEQELAQLKADIEARRQAGPSQSDQAAAEQRASEEAAQRRAEAEAAALRQTEEEAAKKAAADAEAKRQADEAVAMAEAQRKQAEADALAKAEAEAAARNQASEEAQRKAEAEAATRRQADEAQAKAQAAREKAEAEAKIKAEADKSATAAAKLKDEAETAEKALRLELADRQRLQVALTSLGFDTRGNDGVFGSRSRDMIAGWQKKASAPATGFLTAQRDQLLRAAAPAITRWDEEQKKIEDEKKKPDATQAAATLNQSGSAASAPPASGPAPPRVASTGASLTDGTYRGGLGIYARAFNLEVRMSNGKGSGSVTSSTCGTAPISLTVDASGNVTGAAQVALAHTNCQWVPAQITGRVDGGMLLLAISGRESGQGLSSSRGEAKLSLGGASQTAAASPPALPSPDGLWRGTFKCEPSVGASLYASPEFAVPVEMQLANGNGTWKSNSPAVANGFTLEIKVSVEGRTARVARVYLGTTSSTTTQAGIPGTYDGDTIGASGREAAVGNRQCILALRRG